MSLTTSLFDWRYDPNRFPEIAARFIKSAFVCLIVKPLLMSTDTYRVTPREADLGAFCKAVKLFSDLRKVEPAIDHADDT